MESELARIQREYGEASELLEEQKALNARLTEEIDETAGRAAQTEDELKEV